MSSVASQIIDVLNQYNTSNAFLALASGDQASKDLDSLQPLIIIDIEKTDFLGVNHFKDSITDESKIGLIQKEHLVVDIISDHLQLLTSTRDRFNLIVSQKLKHYPISFQNISIAEERKHRLRGRLAYTYTTVYDTLDSEVDIGALELVLVES